MILGARLEGQPVLTVSTLAGAPGQVGYVDATGTQARFRSPYSVAFDAAGNLYEADSYGSTIRKITPGGVVTTLAGQDRVYGHVDGTGSAASFQQITAMAMGPNQTLYVYDYSSLRKVTLSGMVTTVAIGLRANCTSLAVDASGNAYTASSMSVEKISATGVVSIVVVFPSQNYIQSLAIDGSGTLYTVDDQYTGGTTIGTVWRIVPGVSSSQISLDTGISNGTPMPLAVDASGALYAADGTAGTLLKLTQGGGILAGAVGQSGYADGTGSQVRFRGPAGIAIGPQGQIAIADTGNDVVRVGALPVFLQVPPIGAHLINLSARGYGNSGANALVAGFYVGGNASETKPVLMRGVGPTLAQFGVTDAMGKAAVTLFRAGGEAVYSNDGWGTDPLLAATAAQVQAFALPANSGDSAIVWALYPGGYTVQVTDDTGVGGEALAEVYDAAPNDGTLQLLNLSARAPVGNGHGNLTGGFVISGSGAMTVLIRAVGPTLAQYGVPSPLSAPVLTVYSGQSVIVQNAGWPATTTINGSTVSLATVFNQIGAFALPAGSTDSAVLISLPGGVYTAQLSPASGSTGDIGLIEIYAVPGL